MERLWYCMLLATLILTTLLDASHAGGRVHHYKWQVKYQFWSPDCVEKLIITVNDQFPGPLLRAREGDTLIVEVENLLPTEGIFIHWHGINQIGTPWFDGSAGISQCPISPSEKFTYKFVVDKAGTYFYHGHFGLQRSAGFYGSLIVDLPENKYPPFKYDGELSIFLNDWWHKSIYEQELGLLSNPFRWVGEPQSLLIEGRGRYNCSDLVSQTNSSTAAGNSLTCDAQNVQCSPHVLSVVPGKTYRLRIASVASLSSPNLVIEGHKMTVVVVDSHYVEPFEVDNLDVYAGQTYSVLINANQDPSRNYWVGVNVRGRLPKTPTGLAILNYLPNPSTNIPATSPPQSPTWNDTAYSLAQSRRYFAKQGYDVVPTKADREIILLNTQNKIDGFFKWALNNISLSLPATPYLAATKYKLKNVYDASPPPDNYPADYDIRVPPSNINATYGSGVYMLEYNNTIDVILQNANTLTPNNSEIHPWHLHGHHFWILGYGTGKFDPTTDPKSYNLKNPPLRDTVAVFPYGWTAIRFLANNPGVWPFHCHVEPHFLMGMGVVFAEGIERVGKLPKSTLGCGLTKKLLHT